MRGVHHRKRRWSRTLSLRNRDRTPQHTNEERNDPRGHPVHGFSFEDHFDQPPPPRAASARICWTVCCNGGSALPQSVATAAPQRFATWTSPCASASSARNTMIRTSMAVSDAAVKSSELAVGKGAGDPTSGVNTKAL